MPDPRRHWLAATFVLFGLACVVGLVALASGRVRVDSELPGLGVGVAIVTLLWLGIRRR